MQSLLSFILHMDAGRYLDPTARNEVNTEIAHYVQVCGQVVIIRLSTRFETNFVGFKFIG